MDDRSRRHIHWFRLVTTLIPLVACVRHYRRGWLVRDLLAGLTVWAVMVPTALAYTGIAGVNPVVGLYTVPLALIGYALFGSSRSLVVGPDSATALLSAHTIGTLLVASPSGHYLALTTTLALLVGLFFLGLGLLRMGWVANFISQPVMKGFIQGLALVTMVTQFPKLLGIPENHGGDFLERLQAIGRNLTDVHAPTLFMGLSGLVVLVALSRWAPRVPAALVAVILSIGLVHGFDLGDHGVALVGTVATGLPPIGLPDVSWNEVRNLASGALAIVLLNYAESLAAAKATALVRGEKVEANQELVGLGMANLGAGLSSGFVVAGSLSQSAVSMHAGGKTQVASLFHAAFILLTLMFLMPVFSGLPQAILGAIVVKAMVQMLDFAYFRQLLTISRMEFVLSITACLGVLLIGVLPGVGLGVILSLVVLVYEASHPATAVLGKMNGPDVYRDTARHPEAVTTPGLLIFRVEGNLFFANAAYFSERLNRCIATGGKIRMVLIDAETIDQIDTTAGDMLLKVREDLAKHGITLCLARVRDTVRDQLQSSGVEAVIGADNIFDSITESVDAFLLDREPGGRRVVFK